MADRRLEEWLRAYFAAPFRVATPWPTGWSVPPGRHRLPGAGDSGPDDRRVFRGFFRRRDAPAATPVGWVRPTRSSGCSSGGDGQSSPRGPGAGPAAAPDRSWARPARSSNVGKYADAAAAGVVPVTGRGGRPPSPAALSIVDRGSGKLVRRPVRRCAGRRQMITRHCYVSLFQDRPSVGPSRWCVGNGFEGASRPPAPVVVDRSGAGPGVNMGPRRGDASSGGGRCRRIAARIDARTDSAKGWDGMVPPSRFHFLFGEWS